MNVIEPKFTLENYVFDCYIDQKQIVWLIDFNVWGTQTDSLLFNWEELEQMKDNVTGERNQEQQIQQAHLCEAIDGDHADCKRQENEGMLTLSSLRCPRFLFVESEGEVYHDPLASYRAPIDTIDLATDSKLSNSFAEFMSLCSKPSDL